MTFGPIQLMAVGFQNDTLKGEIARELLDIRERGLLRVVDLLFVKKEQSGNVVAMEETELTKKERMELRGLIAALLGIGAGAGVATESGRADVVEQALAGAEAGVLLAQQKATQKEFGLSPQELRQVAKNIPLGMSVAMVLFEHRWAIGLRNAIRNAGGVLLAEGMVTPEMLLALGAELETATEVTRAGRAQQEAGQQKKKAA